jgi:DNA repair exonuclease SbcCD nuclease subunit
MILIIGDPHFREGNLSDMDYFVNFTIQFVQSHPEIEFIVVLGDVLDRHGVLHQHPFHQACKFLHRMGAMKRTFVLIGNHDFDNPSKFLPDNHPFLMWKLTDCPGVVIVDKPMNVGPYVFVPYVPPGMFRQALEYIDPSLKYLKQTSIIFAHQEFRGCRMGPVISDIGDPWPLNDIANSPLVISGHIHEKQELENGILYVGTPIQNGFSDSYLDKGICLFDTVKRKGEWFHVPIPRKMIVRIPVGDLDSWILSQYVKLYGPIKTKSVNVLFKNHTADKALICVPDKIKLVIYVQDTNDVKKALIKNIQDVIVSVCKIALEVKSLDEIREDAITSKEERTIRISELLLNRFNPEADPLKTLIFKELTTLT